MCTFFFFGSYSQDAVKSITAKRTAKAEGLISGFGGKMRSVYALLGQFDLVIIADLPGIEEAMQASVEMSIDSGITFNTCPAVPVADFDSLMA